MTDDEFRKKMMAPDKMVSPIKKEIRSSALDAAKIGSGGELIRRFRFNGDFIGFSGHFPGNPILPAVIQVIAAQTLVEDATKQARRLEGVDNAKFLEPIFPGVVVEITCRPHVHLNPHGGSKKTAATKHESSAATKNNVVLGDFDIEDMEKIGCRVHLVESGKRAADFTLCLSPREKELMGS